MSCEQELSGELSSYPASPLVKAGHTVAIINYTRAPKQNLQDMQTQVIISFLFGCNLSAKQCLLICGAKQVERAGAWLVRWGQAKGRKV